MSKYRIMQEYDFFLRSRVIDGVDYASLSSHQVSELKRLVKLAKQLEKYIR